MSPARGKLAASSKEILFIEEEFRFKLSDIRNKQIFEEKLITDIPKLINKVNHNKINLVVIHSTL